MRNYRTDLVAYAGLATIFIGLGLVFMGKAILSELSHLAGLVSLGLITWVFKMTKDSNK